MNDAWFFVLVLSVMCGISVLTAWAAVIVMCVTSRRERRDLYNRIMCASIKEYEAVAGNPPPPKPGSRHEQIMKDWRRLKKEDD